MISAGVDWGSPFKISSTDKTDNMNIEIEKTDLDSNGIYAFKNPENGNKPFGFVVSKMKMDIVHGPSILNFDFVGTSYDWDTAVDVKHADDKADDWTNKAIGKVITKGIRIQTHGPIQN